MTRNLAVYGAVPAGGRKVANVSRDIYTTRSRARDLYSAATGLTGAATGQEGGAAKAVDAVAGAESGVVDGVDSGEEQATPGTTRLDVKQDQ